MVTTKHTALNRHDRRHADDPPELMTKKQVAEFLQCSQRQVELLTRKKRICQPVYLGTSSPRWKRDELLVSIGNAAQGMNGGAK